ncbi:Planctomycete cytochrome C [Cyclobacterium xiamenense]|uniref:Planctomycete cytochrome C n=1 Tax=Cyclobacterium xiamenense TaxID=1297121 RepID=A0A1H6Z7R4_9BACT|nr:DUF1592 domain-containing protein [Cyclobacterium xiamenense]SEJ49461.1 Planctomycete cytochrome C [Cyclobacterium xiamenense]
MKACTWLVLSFLSISTAFSQETLDYATEIIPVLKKNCYSCHNVGNPKGGVNLERYEEEGRIIKDGQLWLKVVDQVRTKEMPPSNKPALNEEEYHVLVEGINGILIKSLEKKTPGKVVIRRLSHTEYEYTVQDLMGIFYDAVRRFPADGSGGGGFDNQGGSLFFTPLKMERYYDAAEEIVTSAFEDPSKWANLVPVPYRQNLWQRFINWLAPKFMADFEPLNPPEKAAEKVIFPFASKAFRRLIKVEEKEKFLDLFGKIYASMPEKTDPLRFDQSVAEVFKAILISPSFLYKMEEEPVGNEPVPLGDFELASRLSYFLWSSMPDDTLFQLAVAGKLQDPQVVDAQVKRMLQDPKSIRFSESFVSQWLGITRLKDPNAPLADQVKFPEFTPPIREAMFRETTAFFHHVLTEEKNFLHLISSEYSFLNEPLARYYGIAGVSGNDFQKVRLTDGNRGGFLGMGSVQAVTSLPTRTSPVLRGKWVLEELLGTSPPPPPPDVAELPEDEGLHEELGLKALLEKHRSDPACQSCHEKMDPLGLGLENFGADGKWRESYGNTPIDPSGVLATGETFDGPAELKRLLLEEKEKFARNLSKKALSFAIGRGMTFTDETAIRDLTATLMENQFNPDAFLSELVQSYPFRMKIKDFQKKVNEID